ncbi:xanthine dehydrogenase family protein molybdopterin-binding subunit [Pelagivirga sediminicola]|uniref:Xanthine dehydrogenase family protein molybdopterin-binding subunit n=1 Tax=Pelagivirga sediminicola TaxID=2170575 RepID=A0A2T7G959_9RHOB|nr:molybdopterin cofactor-binding domain-containing protein [Pelagivirga sediminicola]PVA10954.1 xanthine dehydrogenase family protein molybdopterin-binding subunit [Pelagivirga sediminicola]
MTIATKTASETRRTLTRRSLLKGAGGLVVAFSLGAGRVQAQDLPQAGELKSVSLDAVQSYLAIDADGLVTVYSGKIDYGTGVRTGFAQMVAEELYVPLERVTVIEGDTALTPDQGPTYGSLSIEVGGKAIRLAAATAREAMLANAAEQFGAERSALSISDGVISGGGQSISYADLLKGAAFDLDLDEDAALKDPASFTIVGQPIIRDGLPGKITGDFQYMQDFKLEGMVHARVVRPPAISAAINAVDEASISHLKDVQIVRKGAFLAVVAEDEWTAVRAARELAVTWDAADSLPDQAELWEHVRQTPIVKDEMTSDIGDVDAAPSAREITATYDFALHTHGSIGPSCAVADFTDGKLISWSSSQATHRLRRQLSDMFGIPDDDIRCIYIEGAGCYGRNGHEDAAADAALLAREVGRPVRVQWMRHDEHGWDPKGPPTLIDMTARFDDAGDVSAWDTEFFIPQGGGGRVALLGADLADLPTTSELNPGGITNDSAIPYGFPNVRTVCHRLETTPLRPSWIRAPGRMQNTFANECFIDEIAAELGADPMEYRRGLIDQSDARGLEVLDRLRDFSEWEARPSPSSGQEGARLAGRGMAYVKYELKRTYVGVVAEVTLDAHSGAIKVDRFHVVHDCGQIINPAGVRAQIEGNVIQTTSRTLMEELTFDRRMVTSLDWASYPIMRFKDVPEVRIELIDRPNDPPWGAGEPTAVVVSAAISNAVFDAVGARLRSVPFKPEKLRAALSEARG